MGVGVCVCVVQAVSGLLQVPESEISSAMCNRLITAGTDVMIKPETREKANQVLLMTQTHRFISRTEFAQSVRGWFSCSSYSVRMLYLFCSYAPPILYVCCAYCMHMLMLCVYLAMRIPMLYLEPRQSVRGY